MALFRSTAIVGRARFPGDLKRNDPSRAMAQVNFV
jgi:hypothetical protein